MYILEIIPTLQAGGAEVFVVNLCNELCKRTGVKITLLTLYDSSDCFLRSKLDSRVSVSTLPKKRGFDLSMMFKIRRFIKNGKFDVAHFHINAITYAIFAGMNIKCKCVATIHNDAYREASGIHRMVRRILFTLNWIYPITISHQSQQSFQQLYAKPSIIIYNGVPKHNPSTNFSLERYKVTNQTRLLISAAAIYPVKNELNVVRAVHRLISEGEDISFILVGRNADNTYTTEIKKYLSSRIHYLGEVSNPVDYMCSGDYFILASHYEGLPISLLEAVSVGCIPIVTPVGGCIDVVKNQENGFIVNSPEEIDIYNTLKQALNTSYREYDKLQKHVLADAKLYSISYCADSHFKLFQKITKS